MEKEQILMDKSVFQSKLKVELNCFGSLTV